MGSLKVLTGRTDREPVIDCGNIMIVPASGTVYEISSAAIAGAVIGLMSPFEVAGRSTRTRVRTTTEKALVVRADQPMRPALPTVVVKHGGVVELGVAGLSFDPAAPPRPAMATTG